MVTQVAWSVAKMVSVGPRTMFPGNSDETWEPGRGVELLVSFDGYIGTVIVPFLNEADARKFLERIGESFIRVS